MEQWIRDPQQVSPGTAMPDLNVGEGDARDITAFLYTRAQVDQRSLNADPQGARRRAFNGVVTVDARHRPARR